MTVCKFSSSSTVKSFKDRLGMEDVFMFLFFLFTLHCSASTGAGFLGVMKLSFSYVEGAEDPLFTLQHEYESMSDWVS